MGLKTESYDACASQALTENRFLDEYFRMDSRGKITMLLSEFYAIPEKLQGSRDILKIDVICERDYQRSRMDDGVRVHTSHLSDTTGNEAIHNVILYICEPSLCLTYLISFFFFLLSAPIIESR